LIACSLIDRRRISSAVPITDHIEAWQRSIENEGRTAHHIAMTVGRVRKALEGCAVGKWSEMDARLLSDWLADRTGPEGWSVRTHNSYVQSLRQFSKWMLVNEHTIQDPLVSLRPRSRGTGEARRPRRALTVEEARRLVAAAESDVVSVQGVDPVTRGLLYRLAMQTGLRYGELCRLEVGWIEFGGPSAQGGPPRPTTIQPPASATKAGKKTGRVDTIVVPPELATRLSFACRGRHPKARVLDRVAPRRGSSTAVPRSKGVDLIRHDLALAGIPYVDDAGRFVDFHSLRHTALTFFASAGASLDDMLALSRHSDPNVTKGYLHSQLASRARIVSGLPTLDSGSDQASLPRAVSGEIRGSAIGPAGGDGVGFGEEEGDRLVGRSGVNADSATFCNPSPYHLAMPP
ncbi:MAG: hypothetical protein AAFP22_07775, partial [Planctomycetota bacterium]